MRQRHHSNFLTFYRLTVTISEQRNTLKTTIRQSGDMDLGYVMVTPMYTIEIDWATQRQLPPLFK